MILEAEALYEGKRREVEEERRAKEIGKKIEDRPRLEREGDEMMEAIKRHELVEEEKKEERIEKAVMELMEATVEGWRQGEEEKGCAEVDEVRKWRTNEEFSVEEARELEEEILVAGRRCMHEWEEEKECREADEVRKVLEMAKRKTREAEENTKVVEKEDDCCCKGKGSRRSNGNGTYNKE